jgi:hypothetical protein
MKQQGDTKMRLERADRVECSGSDFRELAELDAWEGYEFWSAQLEAHMVSVDDGASLEGFSLVQLERKAGQTDVLPF